MSEVQGDKSRPPGGKARLVWAAVGVMAILALVYGAWAMVFKPGAGQGLDGLNRGDMSKLEVLKTPAPPPATTLQGPDGKSLTLADLKGQVLVVNLWASWCAPCAKEMPTLAGLQAAFKDRPVKVVAISLDRGEEDIAKAKARIAQNAPLGFYHAPYDLAFAMKPAVEALPTTIFYDRDGRERARLTAPADWTKPEAKAVVNQLLALKESAP
jgi:thiol-disulfide isomerase/thioredoxin